MRFSSIVQLIGTRRPRQRGVPGPDDVALVRPGRRSAVRQRCDFHERRQGKGRRGKDSEGPISTLKRRPQS
jgi:hypothetical protein